MNDWPRLVVGKIEWQGHGMSNSPAHDDPLALDQRGDLPHEFRLILGEHPRAGWPDHADFNGLAAFWRDRHLAFRRMLASLATDAGAMLERQIAPETYAARLSRLGSRLLGDLLGHHQVEDDVYFPELARLEPKIARGFDMLDADHHALHGLIDRFATGGNAVLTAKGDPARHEAVRRFTVDLGAFDRLLTRHLADEEDLVVPVVLKHRVG